MQNRQTIIKQHKDLDVNQTNASDNQISKKVIIHGEDHPLPSQKTNDNESIFKNGASIENLPHHVCTTLHFPNSTAKSAHDHGIANNFGNKSTAEKSKRQRVRRISYYCMKEGC